MHWSQFVPNMATRHPRTLSSTSSSSRQLSHEAEQSGSQEQTRTKHIASSFCVLYVESRREQNLSRHHFVCSMGEQTKTKTCYVIILCALHQRGGGYRLTMHSERTRGKQDFRGSCKQPKDVRERKKKMCPVGSQK